MHCLRFVPIPFPKGAKHDGEFSQYHGKNGFVTAAKLGTTDKIFVAAATKRFVGMTKQFVVVAKFFCYPYFNK